MSVEYYHTSDPLEHLRLRVVVRETSRSSSNGGAEREETEPLLQLDALLAWQQKLFSPSEIADYLQHRERSEIRNRHPLQTESRTALSRLEREGTDPRSLLSSRMLYTYTDRQAGSADSDVSVARGLHRDVPERLLRDQPYKTMRICLATNVRVDELIAERRGNYVNYFTEHVLCSLRVFQDGLVEVSPALSSLADSSQSPVTLSAFLSDQAVHTAMRRGLALLPSKHIHDAVSGSEFEVYVSNAKDVLAPYRREEIIRKDRLLASVRANELRARDVWRMALSEGEERAGEREVVCVCAEIVSGRGFAGRRVFVSYSLSLPAQAVLRHSSDGSALSGRTHVAVRGTGCGFGLRERARERTRASVRPSLSAGTRLALSLSLFILSVVGVVLTGCELPLWLPVALTVFLYAGRGLSPQAVLVARRERGGERGRRQGLRWTLSDVQEEKEDDVVFNHLIDLSLSLPESSQTNTPPHTHPHTQTQAKPSHVSVRPSADMTICLHLTIYSKGLCDRDVLEGYASLALPVALDADSNSTHTHNAQSRAFDTHVALWRPRGDRESELRRCFLGESVTLRDRTFPRSLDSASAALNKFGVLTESAGCVRVRGHCLSYSPRRAQRHAQGALLQGGESVSQRAPIGQGAAGAQKTIVEILKNYRASQSGQKSAVSASLARSLSLSQSIASTSNAARKSGLWSRLKLGKESLSSVRESERESERKAEKEADDELAPLLQPRRERTTPRDVHEQKRDSRERVEGAPFAAETLGLAAQRQVLENAGRMPSRYKERETEGEGEGGDNENEEESPPDDEHAPLLQRETDDAETNDNNA